MPDDNRTRRRFLKAAVATGLIGTAGCSDRTPQNQEDTEKGSKGEESDNDNDQGTGEDTVDSEYSSHIKPGEEFNELIDWRHNHGAVREDYYDSETAREALFLIPRRITKDVNKVGDLSDDSLSIIDDIAPNIVGRGLAGALESDTGTEVSIGIDDAGITDIKYSPKDIEQALKANLNYNEEEDIYTGSFIEQRPHTGNPDLERNVILEQEGNTIKWAAGKEEGKGYDQVFNVKETFEVLDQTTDDELDSVLDGTGGLMNNVADVLQDVFHEGYSSFHELTFAPLLPREHPGGEAVNHGNVRLKRYTEGRGLEIVEGNILEYEEGFRFEESGTVNREEGRTDLSFTYTPDYSNL